MEVSEVRNLVRDLDLTLQPRIVPRYKTWLPLVTQQLRLRNLIQIIGCNLKTNVNNEVCWFYYTLHRTSMSSPLYTSETIDNANPRWSSLEIPVIHTTGYSTASEVIVRLWKRTIMDNTTTDLIVFTWGISFTGLAYIGPKLPNNLEAVLKENSLIFQFHGGYFTPVYCFVEAPELKRLFQPRKVNKEKKAEILKMRKELEMAKFRIKLLEQERARKIGELRMLNQMHSNITEENQDYGSDLMEKYRELNKDIGRLHEWRQNQIDTRETYIQLNSQLAHRRRQLISELSLIYPITQDGSGKFKIHNVHLPDSEDLEVSNDTEVAVALGFVAHTTQMIANFLNIPTRYPIIHYGSRSKVIDHITENLPDNERQFPLFARSKDKLQFRYAVYLLNKNVAQLRWYCGLPTTDLRTTLSNLATFINIKPSQSHLDNSKRTYSTSSLDIEIGNNKQSITPPIQKIIFEKCHRSSRSMSQLKSIKSSLGSSLDQGLDKPVQSLVLGSQSKRICKSEESAIDNKALVLAKDRSSNSSNETLNNAILSNISSTNVENSSQISNEDTIESNIEIMIPTSVSKRINVTDTFEGSVSVRDRSSNSISSCEMALNSSQNGDDSSIDNNITKRNETRDSTSTTNEVLINVNHVIDNALKAGKHNEDYLSENEVLQDCDGPRQIVIPGEKSYDVNEHTAAATETSAYNKEHFAKSCLSLNDIMSCTYDETEKKQRTSSICSYPEEYLSSKDITSQKRYNSDSKKDEADSLHSRNWCHNDANRELMLQTGLIQAAQKSDCYSYDETNKCDFQASSEYIDIIRRSSENVYARTEALANKKTSFKVMKPRL
ncbi:UV radiation resistance-associated gene protein [Anthophora quadrimaculata]